MLDSDYRTSTVRYLTVDRLGRSKMLYLRIKSFYLRVVLLETAIHLLELLE